LVDKDTVWQHNRIIADKERNVDREQIQQKIDELEQEQDINEFGSLAYDVADAELQYLYCQRDRLVDN